MTGRPRDDAIRTLLMTDVVGSTRLWATHPDAMPELLRCLDDHARRVVEQEGGTVVKARGEGDSLFCVFSNPPAAVRAADALLRALEAESCGGVRLSLRAAIHCGLAVERDADIYGPVPNRCARLREIGHGGQILLSDAARAQIAPSDGMGLLDLGRHRLRDLDEPERVWQVGEVRFPPLRSLTSLRNNLPIQFTSFVGREALRLELVERLKTDRLTTLTGAGGCGKTRLALQLGADAIDAFPEGVWFVELADVSTESAVVRAIADACGHRDLPDVDPLSALVHRLLGRDRLLILLDNAEQALAPIVVVVAALLAALPQARFVVTSREPLRLRGERVHRVPPLSVPPAGCADPSVVEGTEAGALFVDRARLRLPGFELRASNAASLTGIVRRLDGIPLCLEMVASHVDYLGLDEIANRLNDRFALLQGDDAHAPPRHRTMRETIAWQFDTLLEAERLLLQRLAAFAGSFDLDAAEAVGGETPLDPDRVLRHLRALVDKSLVVATPVGGWMRYRLLETIAQFAADSPEGGTEMAMPRLVEWAQRLAEEGYRHLHGSERTQWAALLDEAYSSIRRALDWAFVSSDSSYAHLTLAMTRYWHYRGRILEGRTMLQRGSAIAKDAGRRLETDNALGVFAKLLGDYEAAEAALRRVLDATGDQDAMRVKALNNYANLLEEVGRLDEALARYEEASALALAQGALASHRIARFNVGILLSAGEDRFRALETFLEAERLFSESGDDFWNARCLAACAAMYAKLDDDGEAVRYLRRALDRMGSESVPQFVCDALIVAALRSRWPGKAAECAYYLGGMRRMKDEFQAYNVIHCAKELTGIKESVYGGTDDELSASESRGYGDTQANLMEMVVRHLPQEGYSPKRGVGHSLG